MASAPCGLPPNNDNEEPNHIILWLDVTIGNPAEYQHLKKAFASNTDPCAKRPMMLNDRDYDNLINASEPQTVRFEGVIFLLQAFTNEEKCLEAFEKNQDKRIFFIVSGQMGQRVVPGIIERYERIFTDLITNKPYPSIYIFCHNFQLHLEWAMDYIDYIQFFNFDADLLERITRDIAEYFIERGQRMRQVPNLNGALQRFHWAKRLWHQYDRMQQKIPTDTFRPVRASERMKQIIELIREIDPNSSQTSFDDPVVNAADDDDDKVACESSDQN